MEELNLQRLPVVTANWAELGSAGSGEHAKLGDEWQISEGASLQI